jgi:hypothetical protein
MSNDLNSSSLRWYYMILFSLDILNKNSDDAQIKIKDIEHVEVDSGNGAPQGDKYFEGGKHLFVRVSSLNINKNNEVHSDPVSMINESAIKDYNLDNLHYQLFDVNGRLIRNENISNTSTIIDMNQLQAAVYLLKVIEKNK